MINSVGQVCQVDNLSEDRNFWTQSYANLDLVYYCLHLKFFSAKLTARAVSRETIFTSKYDFIKSS